MSVQSHDAFEAISVAKAPREVRQRTSLWSGGVVSIKIPAVCKESRFEDRWFIQFARPVTGGFVNLFVQGDNPTKYCGKTIMAEAEILQKTFVDGESFYHIDLTPTDKPVTHRIIIESRAGLPQQEGALLFPLPKPLGGEIVVTAPKPPKVRVAKSTGDAQLDRLLADGWTQVGETEKVVKLVKCSRNIEHHKRKKK